MSWSQVSPSIVRPLRYAAARAIFRRSADLESTALERDVLLHAKKIPALAPFAVVEHFKRVLDTPIFTAREIVSEHLLRAQLDLFPLVRYKFENVALINGSLFIADRLRVELRSMYEKRGILDRLSIGARNVRFEQFGVLASGVAGSSWFGHWLEDELPLLMAVSKIGPPVSHARSLYSHEHPYFHKLGLLPPRQFEAAVFDEFVILDEFGQNADKVKRFAEMRRLLRTAQGGSEKVYLRRGQTGVPRQLDRESDLTDRLIQVGYRVVEMENASLDDLVNECANASIIVGIEGSHLAHALFTAPQHCLLVILNPPYQVHTTVADLASFVGLHAAMFVCESSEGSKTNFKLDIDELFAFIDRGVEFAAKRRGPLTAFLGELLESKPVHWR